MRLLLCGCLYGGLAIVIFNVFWMALSTVTRLGVGFVQFALIARHLGPAEFGHYMFWFGVTYLCALLPNFGLSNMLLKEVAQRPGDADELLGEALSLRVFFAAAVLLIGCISAFWVDRPYLVLLLLVANLLEVVSETFYVAYRATGHYSREARLASIAALIQLALVSGAIYAEQPTTVVAFAFLGGRLAQLLIIVRASRPAFGRTTLNGFRRVFALARRATAYAIDFALSNLFGNIDSIALRIFVGVEAVGLFQSGMRIFQGGGQAASILANVFLPSLARAAANNDAANKSTARLQIVFLAFGASFGLVLTYFSQEIVTLAFGAQYSALAGLLPMFGLLFFVRFFAASWGLILTARGHQSYRARATAIHLIIALLLGIVLTPNYGVEGRLIALLISNVLLALLYMIRVIRQGAATSSFLVTGAALVGCALFFPRLL